MNNKQTILGFVALIAVLILGVVYYTKTDDIPKGTDQVDSVL